MKIPAIILAVFVLFTGGLLLFLWISAPASSIEFDQEAFAELPAGEQNRLIDEILARPALPPGQEDAVLKWIFRNDHRRGKILLQENAFAIRMLPEHLASSAMDLVESGDLEEGIEALALARQSFPNDPNVLSTAGAVAFLGGRRDDARRLLEQAENWRINNPRTDFYLGGLLIGSDSVADQARGKNLLLRVVNGAETELAERAGLALLVNRALPLTRPEKADILEVLEEGNTFRPDNVNLNADVLRTLANVAAESAPEKALPIASLIFAYPGSTMEDELGYIELAQGMGEFAAAEERLENLPGENAFPAEERNRLRRVRLLQHIVQGRYEAAEKLWTRLSSAAETPARELAGVVRALLANEDVPNAAELRFFEKFLAQPVVNPRFRLNVLERLIQLRPVQQDEYFSYATRTILPEDPMLVAGWLTSQGKQDLVIAELEESDAPLSDSGKRALLEAYLAAGENEKAAAILPGLQSSLPVAVYSFYDSRLQYALGNLDQALEAWNAAQNAAQARNSFPLLKNLGFHALQMEQPINALQSLYTAFTAGVPFSQDQAVRLQALSLRYGTLRQTLNVAKDLAERYPESENLRNNLAYFKFIANEEIDRYLENMRSLVSESPDNLNYNITLALGLLQSGREREANRVLEASSFDWNAATPRQQLVYAAVLMANGERVVAQGLLQNLERDQLIPEEKALLDSI